MGLCHKTILYFCIIRCVANQNMAQTRDCVIRKPYYSFAKLDMLLIRELIHCGLLMPFGDRDLDQHWLRYWLVAWRHEAITWTNVDWSSGKFGDIYIRAISQELPQPSITKICLKITCLKFHLNFPGANDLTQTRCCSLECLEMHLCQWTVSLLVQIMPWCLLNTKPWFHPMLACCWLELAELLYHVQKFVPNTESLQLWEKFYKWNGPPIW